MSLAIAQRIACSIKAFKHASVRCCFYSHLENVLIPELNAKYSVSFNVDLIVNLYWVDFGVWVFLRLFSPNKMLVFILETRS